MSKIVEGLRGDAFIIARTVGLDALMTEGDEWCRPGVEVSIEAMRSSVLPLTTHEAKEMFRQYCNLTGALSIVSYTHLTLPTNYAV